MRWNKSNYLGAHEWIKYGDVRFATWDKYAQGIIVHGVNVPRSFRGGKPKMYRYWYRDDGYRYWIVGNILNRAKL